jgi:hypothetical protein
MQLWGATLGVLMLRLNAIEVTRRMPAPLDVDALVPTYVDLALNAIRA